MCNVYLEVISEFIYIVQMVTVSPLYYLGPANEQ